MRRSPWCGARRAFLGALLLAGAACGGAGAPAPLPLSPAAAALPEDERRALTADLERLFGAPGAPRLAAPADLGFDPNAPAPLGLAPDFAREIALDNRTRFFEAFARLERGEAAASQAQPASLQRALASAADPSAVLEGWQPDLAESAQLFALECASCHGLGGAGDGPAAAQLDPPPRDFQAGEFRYHPGGPGRVPTQGDLAAVMRRGVPGAGMPMFARLGAARHSGLADWVRYLALRGELERAWLAEHAANGRPSAAWLDARYAQAWARWAILLAPRTEPQPPARRDESAR